MDESEAEWVSPTGKSFRSISFVHVCLRACVRAVWFPSGIWTQKGPPAFLLFPYAFSSFPFSLFPSPHPPNLPSNFSRAYRYFAFNWLIMKQAIQETKKYKPID